MEAPAVSDGAVNGLDPDQLRFSLRADESDCVGDIAEKEGKALENIDEDASSLREMKSDFADETAHEEENGKSVEEENKIPENSDFEDMKVQEDTANLSTKDSDCADDIVQEEEKPPQEIEEDTTSLRAENSDFPDDTVHREETDEIAHEEETSPIQREEKTPEKSVNEEGLKIQEDGTSLRAEDSDHAAETQNEEEKAPENIKNYATSFGARGSDSVDNNEITHEEETNENAKQEEKTPEKLDIDMKVQENATSLRAEDSDCANDIAQKEEKAPEKIEEDATGLSSVKSDFVVETVQEEETDEIADKEEDSPIQKEENTPETSVIEKDLKIQEDATGLRADDLDHADDIRKEEETAPENIQEYATGLGAHGSDSADSHQTTHKEETDEDAKKEEKTPDGPNLEKDEKVQDDSTSLGAEVLMRSATERSQEDATSLRVQNSEFGDETAQKVPNNHAAVDEPAKKEVNTEKESTQEKQEQKVQPAPRLDSSSGKPTNTAPTPGPSPARPAGLGRAAPLLEPAPRAVQQTRVNGTASQLQTQQIEDSNGEAEEYDETREKLQMIRVKFLRLAHRLGQTPHNVVVAQVLYRLGLAEQLRGRNGGRVGAFSFDRASAMAEQLEAAGQEPLDFSCTIMVLGKTGVGKSATINSIFDEQKFCTDAFQMGTQKVQDVVGTVQGIKVRVIDTPGLLSSWSDQRKNVKILQSVKRFIKKTPPDIVLYLDRLDMQSRDFGDMPLLRTITEIFGPSIWFNAIVVLTHAASAPPDGPNGTASSYDMFVTQRSHVVQQAIRQAAGDMRLMNPVSLVENHSACRTNRAGQRVLPNGQVWKPHLLLLSFASKILAEANTLLKLQDSPPGKPFPTRSRAPPLPFLLSSLLQSRPQLKLPGEQVGGDEDDDLDGSSDSDNETEYEDLPPFTRLTKAQVAMLSKAQKKAYFDELAYREKLFMKRQLKEEKRQRKLMKEMAASGQGMPTDNSVGAEEETDTAISPAPMPDLALPASFDSSNPTHRYRCLDSVNQWVVRPVLDTHGWDHDVGYEGINVERFFVVKNKLPVAFSGQASKDKKDVNIQMEINSSLSHGEGKATSMGFDLQTVGKDMAYTLRGETKFCNHRRNKATAGLSVNVLGDALSAGLKLEDKLIINKCLRMVMAGGAMSCRGDVAYGGSLEAQWRDKDYPIGRFLSTLGLSIMDWHGDLAIGGNIQSQVPIGRSTNLIARANLNNRGAGQISIRFTSSEQLQIALFGLIPLLRKAVDQLSQLQYGQQ